MLKALGNNIIVKPFKEEEKKTVVLTIKEEKPLYWQVLATGKDVSEIFVGDHVYIQQYGVQEINYENEKLYVVSIDKVYAKK